LRRDGRRPPAFAHRRTPSITRPHARPRGHDGLRPRDALAVLLTPRAARPRPRRPPRRAARAHHDAPRRHPPRVRRIILAPCTRLPARHLIHTMRLMSRFSWVLVALGAAGLAAVAGWSCTSFDAAEG